MLDLLEVASEPNRRRLLQLLGSGVGVPWVLEAQDLFYSVEHGGMARLKADIDAFWTNELDLLVAEAGGLGAPLTQGES